MTIAIDCRFAATYSGLGRYTRELTLHLLKRQSDTKYVLIVRSKDENWIPKNMNHFDVIEAPIPHYSLAEQTTLPSIIAKTGAGLLFSPHFNVPLRCPVPFVATIHDLILHRFPNDASLLKKIAYRVLIGHAIRKANALIAVSDFVRGEITEEYGSSLPPIHVVREGVSELYRPADEQRKEEIRKKYSLQKKFFLYVGNAKQHKNLSVLLDAFSRLNDPQRELVLLCSGKERDRLGAVPAGVRFLEDVPDHDMPALYSLAEALITMSLYEGYCLPVAEALACGCPVIASNRSAIPEIAKGHAELIEPTIEECLKALKKTYSHQSSYLVGSWQKAAEETEKILRSVVRHSEPAEL